MSRSALILGKSVIWAFAGALFGGVFNALVPTLAMVTDVPWVQLMVSAGLAGAVIAAFFGAMQVAILGSLTGILAGIGSLILLPNPEHPYYMALAGTVLGALAGMLFPAREALRERPLGQTLAGVVAGLGAGVLLWLIIAVAGLRLPVLWLTLAAVAGVGIGYVFLLPVVARHCSPWVSAHLSGPLVTALIALCVASALWLTGNSVPSLDQTQTAEVARILEGIPAGMLGGAIGGAVGGALLELLGIETRWQPPS